MFYMSHMSYMSQYLSLGCVGSPPSHDKFPRVSCPQPSCLRYSDSRIGTADLTLQLHYNVNINIADPLDECPHES